MTAHGILGIDHPVIAVRDMAAARAAYERIGFTIPPRGSHLEWGTGNWCIMFPHDYLELRGITDPAKYTHGLAAFLDHRQGLMGTALATADAEASYLQLTAAGLRPQPVRHLTRNFELPEGRVQPRFALCMLDEGETPGLMSVVLCQHLTPELIRRPPWLEHANGARCLRSLTAVVDDLSAATAAHQALFGRDAVRCVEGVTVVRFHRGHAAQEIRLTTRDRLSRLHPHCIADEVVPTVGLAVVTLDVHDTDATARWLAERGVSCRRDAVGTVCLDPRDTCGVALEFAAKNAN